MLVLKVERRLDKLVFSSIQEDGPTCKSAIDHLWSALKVCGNYTPVFSMLSAIYERGGNKEDKARLNAYWDSIPEPEDESTEDPAPADGDQGLALTGV